MSNITGKDPNDTALPVEWGYRTLGEIAEITMGNSPPGESYNEEGIGVPLVNGPVEFSEGAFGLTKKIKFTTAPTKVCRSGDFLICVRGSTTGRTNIAAFDACIGRGVASIRAKMSQRYLNHFVRTLEKRIHASGKGSTFPSISQQQLADLSIPLPSPDNPKRSTEEQKRIADILDKADAIRRQRQDAINLSQDILRSAYLHCFGDPIANPQGWPMKELGELADIVTGFAFKSSEYIEEGIRLCRGANVLPDRIDWSDVRYWRNDDSTVDKKLKLENGDVVLAMDRPWISSGTKVAQLTESDLPAYLVQRVTRLRGIGYISNAFLYYTIRHPAFTAHCGGLKTETIVPHISSADIKSFRVPVAPRHIHEKFDALANNTQAGIQRQRRATNEATSLFNSVVQRAFKGDL